MISNLKDNRLEYWIQKQLDSQIPVSAKIIQSIYNRTNIYPRYNNGTLMKEGDFTFCLLLIEGELGKVDISMSDDWCKPVKNEKDATIHGKNTIPEGNFTLQLITFSSEHLKQVCKEYFYVGGNEINSIQVIKRSDLG